MTARKAGALIDDVKGWQSVVWKTVQRNVRRLQMRIAKAASEGKPGKVKALQWLLTHSYHARLMAVKRVTSNKGKNTPGADGVVWKDVRARMQAVRSLRRCGYKPQPLRRIYIPKKNGKKRPLSIPTMHCRAMQALYKLALNPVAETTADPNSYGFRELRSCADAVAQAFKCLSKPNSATWVPEADLKGCYDNISSDWMTENIPMDKQVLRKWSEAGYVGKGITYPTRKGTPRGGIISPTLANMVLDGPEQVVRQSVPRRSGVNFIRYADDFIITGKSERILENNVRPAVERFLAERGPELSPEKTGITYIKDGFTFLGQTFCRHGRKLHIMPSEEGVHALMQQVGTLIRKYQNAPTPLLIRRVNQTLRGWGNCHRWWVSSCAFRKIDNYVYQQLRRTVRKKHRNKPGKWLQKKYWSAAGRNTFSVKEKTKKGKPRIYRVARLSEIGIRRYVKVRAHANPYLKEFGSYFQKRKHDRRAKIASTWGDVCNRVTQKK